MSHELAEVIKDEFLPEVNISKTRRQNFQIILPVKVSAITFSTIEQQPPPPPACSANATTTISGL